MDRTLYLKGLFESHGPIEAKTKIWKKAEKLCLPATVLTVFEMFMMTIKPKLEDNCSLPTLSYMCFSGVTFEKIEKKPVSKKKTCHYQRV